MEKYGQYKTSHFLKEKIFVGKEESTIPKEDKSFVEDVLSKSEFPNHFPVNDVIEAISLVDSNYECDVYQFTHDDKVYCLKINEDDEDEKKLKKTNQFYEFLNTDIKGKLKEAIKTDDK